MILLNRTTWETAGAVAFAAIATAGFAWYFIRKRPTPDEIERLRRKELAESGRLVDGMLLDVREIVTDDGRTLTMLEYNYRIGGADYECSQDITAITGVAGPAQTQAGFPCSVRYQPGSPQNSIVVAEEWSGLRSGWPPPPALANHKDPELEHLRPGKG